MAYIYYALDNSQEGLVPIEAARPPHGVWRSMSPRGLALKYVACATAIVASLALSSFPSGSTAQAEQQEAPVDQTVATTTAAQASASMLQGVSAKAKDAYASACAARDQAASAQADESAEDDLTYVAASEYGRGDGLMGSGTASGERITADSMGVAMRTMPLGTVVEITYGDATVRATVNDRGPYSGNRQIDLQPAVAEALGFSGTGTVGYRVVG